MTSSMTVMLISGTRLWSKPGRRAPAQERAGYRLPPAAKRSMALEHDRYRTDEASTPAELLFVERATS
jgi:hypothetical protein